MAKSVITILSDKFDTKILNKFNKLYINKYDILGPEVEYYTGKAIQIGMEMGLGQKTPTLNIRFDPQERSESNRR